MKKSVLFYAMFILLIACKSNSPVETKLDNRTESSLKGDWVIRSVNYPGSDYIKVNSFELADSKCFILSDWHLVSNNNKGTITLTNGSCISFSSDITWYINKDNQFVMKILNADKAKKVSQGYVLMLGDVTENSFQLIDKIKIGDKATPVVYQFERKK